MLCNSKLYLFYLKIAELRRGVINFVNGGSNGEASADAYGENGSFHSANLEIEYQKRLVVSFILRTLENATENRYL